MKTKRRLTFLFSIFLIFLLLSGSAFSQQGKLDFADLEKVALEELKQTLTPGAAIAIVSGDRIVFTKGFGVSSIETRAPVTSDMLFRNGSGGKMLTAAALVSLA